MSDAESYFSQLTAQGYSPEKAKEYTSLYFPNSELSSKSRLDAQTDTPVEENSSTRPPNEFYVTVLISITSIILIFVSMYSNSWMTGIDSDDNYELNFGLSEIAWDEFGVESGTDPYSVFDGDEEFAEAEKAGTTAVVFLWLGVIAAIASLSLFVLRTLGIYESKYSELAAFTSGGLILIGIVSWLVMFPKSELMDEIDEVDLGLGIAFYLALIGGLAIIVSGLFQAKFGTKIQFESFIGSNTINSNGMIGHESPIQQLTNSTLVSLSLVLVTITLIFISMFTNSWMTDTEGEVDIKLGLSYASSEYDGSTYKFDYSSEECQEDEECAQVSASGTTAKVLLWLAVGFSIAALILIYLSDVGNYKVNYGINTAIIGGVISIIASITWYFMFPENIFKSDLDLTPGISFYLAVMAGILGIFTGVRQKKISL